MLELTRDQGGLRVLIFYINIMSKRHLPAGITEEQISEFWKHKIHPIMGYKTHRGDISKNSEDSKQKYHRSLKRNQFNNRE